MKAVIVGGHTQERNHIVLGIGAAPVLPSVPGAERALTLRDVADAEVIAEAAARSRTAVVVGAGFIGLEMAESLHTRGCRSHSSNSPGRCCGRRTRKRPSQ